MSWEAVFFDFDGVVVDSVPIKTEAFKELFRSFGPEIETAVEQYHLRHGGVSRIEKFRYFYKNLLHRPIDSTELNLLNEKFSQLVFTKVVQAPYIPGAMESFQFLQTERIPAFIVSGTPQIEIQEIVKRRGLESFFSGVFGSPPEKTKLVKNILESKKFLPEKCLLVGDSTTDFEAARLNGMKFLGIVPENGKSPFSSEIPTAARVTTVFAEGQRCRLK